MEYPVNGTNQEKFDYIYQRAKELGDKFPEITASQFALETGYGKSIKGTNNLFNQTALGDNLSKRKWVNYSSIDDSIKARVNKWSERYKDAPDAVAALAKIQPAYAPNADKNKDYIKSVMKIAKTHGKYNGKVNLPNADVDPSFYSSGEYLASNEKDRAKINDTFKKANQDNVASKDPNQIYKNQEKVKSYWKEISNIQGNKKLSEEEKNAQKHAVKSKYYREGYMASVNVDINETNKKYDSFVSKMKKMSGRNGDPLISDDGMIHPNAEIITKKEFESLKKEAAQFNIDLGNPHYGVAGGDKSNKHATRYIAPDYIKKKLTEFNKLYTPRKIEQGILKYGKTKDEYDAEVGKESNVSTNPGILNDLENSSATIPETAQEKSDRLKVEASEKARGEKILAAKNKPFEGSDVLNSLTAQDEFADPRFKYTPGKGELPFGALAGLATGIAGAASAESVHIKYRDEQVSEGMLLYAQDMAKIKNMGLSPEQEGVLNMKLQDAYQTGINNLVRASNGNRNLVLGNQGQLDKARMQSIVEITAFDVDRTDKAMAAFGEVQKYINEFDSRRDIFNNERQYQEDTLKRTSGMAVAQQGMSNFIDAIQNAKENAPGSMNDMRRQLFQFNATGILPNAKEGEIGSLSYKEAKAAEYKLFSEKKRTYSDWINGKNAEEKDLINNILTRNPQLNPDVNGKAEFKELEDFYNTVSGTDEYKSDFYKEKKISDLTVSRVKTKKEQITGEPVEDAPPVEKQHLDSIDSPIKTAPVVQTQNAMPSATTMNISSSTAPLPSSRTVGTKNKIAPTIITTEKLSNGVLQQDMANMANDKPYGLNNLTPEAVQSGKRMSKAVQQIDTINRTAEERDLIFNKQQEEAQLKLNSVIH